MKEIRVIKAAAAKCNPILVSGSHGLVGSALVSFLKEKGHRVVRLERGSRSSATSICWNPSTGEVDAALLEGFDAVIHLAGKNISHRRWNKRVKEELFLSRCRDTWLLTTALSRLQRPPKTFLSASAVGYYGSRGSQLLTEETPSGEGFLADLCLHWERACNPLLHSATRIIHARFGVVLSEKGGLLPKLALPIRYHLGACMGKGENFISWIALEDLIGAIEFVLHEQNLKGAINFTDPEPLLQKELLRRIARSVGGSVPFSLPERLVKWVFGEMGEELLLASQRAIPQKLLASGYVFKHENSLASHA